MSFTRKLMQAYFDYVYNPVYDFTIGQLNRYRKLQERCVGKLELKDNDRVLCVGLGTGNEIFHILEINRNVDIVGVDYSHTALQKAYKKALALGKEIELLLMDARHLQFPGGNFDRVVCLHVMDFILDNERVTSEIVRVLKQAGQFVITYPSEKEGAKLLANILKDWFHHNISSRNYIIGLLTFLVQMLMGILYLPLVFRRKRSYSHRELRAMFAELTSGDFEIEEYPAYQDFIVYGSKSTEGG